MSLSQRIINGRVHREQHRAGNNPDTEDYTCSICHHPNFPLPQGFERFWAYYFTYLAPTAEDYSEITVQRYLLVDEFRRSVQRNGRITLATATILQQFQRVLHAIHYHANLRITTTQLAVQVVIASLLSDGFEDLVPDRAHNLLTQFQNPLLNDHPLYPAIQQILTAYAEQSRETRTNSGVAPLIEVAATTTSGRPDTPLDGIETPVDSSVTETSDEETSITEEISESQTRQNTNYNI